jgi:hypothetical protein
MKGSPIKGLVKRKNTSPLRKAGYRKGRLKLFRLKAVRVSHFAIP